MGRQGGKIWQDQGGRVAFEEDINGITLNPDETYGQYAGEFHTGRVAYALKAENYFQHPNAYPCNSEENAPEFCEYQYPDIAAGFGSLVLRPSTLEGELKRFLMARTAICAQDYAEAEFLGGRPDVVFSDLEMDIRIREDGISVDATYPLEYRSGGGSSFRLTTFDTFYSTKFKQLLDAAVAFPLQWDQKFVDFRYEEDTLLNPLFTFASRTDLGDCTPIGDDTPDDETDDYFDCSRSLQADKYNRLGLEFEKAEADNGDDVFIFRAPFNEIILAEEYEFRIARQNRPPALDYIHRNECLLPEEQQYDYLVIKDDEELGDIDLTVTARDADEDTPGEEDIDTSIIYADEPSLQERSEEFLIEFERLVEEQFPGGTEGEPFSVTIHKDAVADVGLYGIYPVKVFAEDKHGAKDWQLLRFLIDRPLEVGLRIIAPYTNYQGLTYVGEGSAWLSQEDPFALIVQLPDEAFLGGQATIELKFTPSLPDSPTWEKSIELQTQYNDDAQNRFCFLFPDERECPSEVADIPDPATADDYEPFWQYFNDEEFLIQMNPDSSLAPFIEGGTLEVGFSFPYCGVEEGNSDRISIASYECLPHYDEEYPFPYIPFSLSTRNPALSDYLKTFYRRQAVPGTRQLTGDEEPRRNPFQASNVCCKEDPVIGFTPKTAETTCFTSPYPGCFGFDPDGIRLLPNQQGILLEDMEVKCRGDRGNICNGARTSTLHDGRMVCGNAPDEEQARFIGCIPDRISLKCRGKDAFSFQDGGVCFDEDLGCTFSSEPLVYLGAHESPHSIYAGDGGRQGELNQEATERFLGGSTENLFAEQYSLGCDTHDGKRCDHDFDGYFGRVCDSGECRRQERSPDTRECNDERTAVVVWNDFGTEIDREERCTLLNAAGTGEYCGYDEERGQVGCLPQRCVSREAMCFPRYLSWLEGEFPDDEEVAELRSAFNDPSTVPADERDEFDVLVQSAFICDDFGRDFDDAACAPSVCGENTMLVGEVPAAGSPDDEIRWECRGCGRDDVTDPETGEEINRPCQPIGGGSGVCDYSRAERRYYCRDSSS